MTSFDVIWHHNRQKRYHVVEQAQWYLINVNLYRCALTGRKPRLGFLSTPTPSLLYHRGGGGLISLYVGGLINTCLLNKGQLNKTDAHSRLVVLYKCVECQGNRWGTWDSSAWSSHCLSLNTTKKHKYVYLILAREELHDFITNVFRTGPIWALRDWNFVFFSQATATPTFNIDV